MELNTFDTSFDTHASGSCCGGCSHQNTSKFIPDSFSNKDTKDYSEVPKPSALRISTMTATSSINSNINLSTISSYLPINEHIKYIEHGHIKKGVSSKNISEKKAKKKKVFYNQITIEVVVKNNITNNIKLFNNGAISMTGLKSEEYGREAVSILLDFLKKTKGVDENDIEHTCLDNPQAEITNFNIVLINSDYYIGYEIKRAELHKLLVNKYKIFSSYEPCIYPGVNSKFYWNEDYLDKEYKGKCYCTELCDGKGCGKGNGNCKKITVSAFQSGSVIITGARNLQQIKTAYAFINNIFKINYGILKKQNAPFLDIDDIVPVVKNGFKKDGLVYLKKSSIKNFSKID